MHNVLKDKRYIAVIVVVVISIIAVYALKMVFGIDTPTLSLIIATAAVVLTVLDATILERGRQQTRLAVEREALRKGLYNEMADIIHVFHHFVFTDLFLMKMKMPRTIDTQLSLLNDMKTKIDRFVSFDVYNSASREPVLFFGLEDEARNINRFYKMIRNGISELDSTIDLAKQMPPQSRPIDTRSGAQIDAVIPHQEEHIKTTVLVMHDFLEIFEDKFLKKAISYLNEDSLDFLGKCIDPDDREYFVSLREGKAERGE